MKVFAIALVSAGLSFAIGFSGGAVLNRPARRKYDAKIAQIRNEATQSEQAVKEKLRQAQGVVQGLEKEIRQLNNELRNMQTALAEANKEVRELRAGLSVAEKAEKHEESVGPKPNIDSKKPQGNPSQVLSNQMFGIYLGEKINELSNRRKIILLNTGTKDEEVPAKVWRVQNNIQNIKDCIVLTYEDRVMSICVIFNDASKDNFEAIDSELRKKYRIIDESKGFSIDPTKNLLISIDNTDVMVNLELKEGFRDEDDRLMLSYAHLPLFNTRQAEIKRRKAAKVGHQL
ncbi:MAG: hypothetical protein ACYSWZ_05050 [Planctomycetota bacterium]|jgi:hypothetical protein